MSHSPEPPIDPAPRAFAVRAVRRLREAGYTAYWAGGCVRDLLMGHTPSDYDIATSAEPDQVRTLFGRRWTIPVGEAFGVILVRGRPGEGDVEVATFRTEGRYLDGRRPESVRYSSPEEDAFRRDFTINGMFFDPIEEQVIDYVGGRADLAAGLVRAIGDPVERFREDKLRMLRAVRMTARFGFQLDPATATAVHDHRAEIAVVSRERIAQELKKMLENERRVQAMELAWQLGLLSAAIPDWPLPSADLAPSDANACWQRQMARLAALENPSFALALAALWMELEPALVRNLARGLRLSNEVSDRVTRLVEEAPGIDEVSSWSPSRIKRLLADPIHADLLALVRADGLARSASLRDVESLEIWLDRLTPAEIDPPQLVSGQDLIAAGLRPGPEFKHWLETIRDAQLDGVIHTRDDALALARRLTRPES